MSKLFARMPVALISWVLFFFQAEDGIRDRNVTGVQTCALPILIDEEALDHVGVRRRPELGASHLERALRPHRREQDPLEQLGPREPLRRAARWTQIGRASCRERV